MTTFALAFRNLLRNRRRSLATIAAMIIGGVAILLFGGYVRNIVYGMQTDFVRSNGHILLQHRDYFLYGNGDVLTYGIRHYDRVIETLTKDPVLAPMLTVITPTLDFGGIAGNSDVGVSQTISASGIEPDGQDALQLWNDYGFPGRVKPSPLTGTSNDSAFIGTGVARVLRLCASLHVENCPGPTAPPEQTGAALPADVALLASRDASQARTNAGAAQIELLAATSAGAPNVARLNVVKAWEFGGKGADDTVIELHLAEAQRLLYQGVPPEVTTIQLQLRHTDQIAAATARIEQLLATSLSDQPLAVYDFKAANPFYGQTVALFDAIFGFIAILIGTIVLFMVGNTMNAAVVERTVEIGTLRAIGVRRSGIRRLFVAEALLLALFGALSSLITAIGIAAVINRSGLTWYPPGTVDPVSLYIRVWGETRLLLGAACGLIGVAVISAWMPARRASRLEVVEALRHA
jgi:putative ABC transport system permease protein